MFIQNNAMSIKKNKFCVYLTTVFKQEIEIRLFVKCFSNRLCIDC